MNIIFQVKTELKITTYNLWLLLQERGIKISKQGFYKLERSESDYIRADILLALMKIADLNWRDMGRLIEEGINKPKPCFDLGAK